MDRGAVGAAAVEHQVVLLVLVGVLAIERVVARLGIVLVRDLKDVLARNDVALPWSIGDQPHAQGSGDGGLPSPAR